MVLSRCLAWSHHISSLITINNDREQRTKEHPRTPDVHRKCSKRAWDGLMKIWRRELHKYDPASAAGEASDEVSLDDVGLDIDLGDELDFDLDE